MIPQQWVSQQVLYVTAVSLPTGLLLESSVIQNGNCLHLASSAKEPLIVSQLAATNSNSFLNGLELVLNDFKHSTFFYNYALQHNTISFSTINAAQNNKSWLLPLRLLLFFSEK